MATKKSSTKKSATKKSSAKSSAKKSSTKKAASTKKSGTKKSASKKKSASRRSLIEPTPGDKRYVRRDAQGQFDKVVDVGRSLAADRRSTSKTKVKSGQGDKGDVKRASSKKSAKKK